MLDPIKLPFLVAVKQVIIIKNIFTLIIKFFVISELGGGGTSHMDDEYRWAGVEDPKILLTTSHDPSSRLKMFVKVFE